MGIWVMSVKDRDDLSHNLIIVSVHDSPSLSYRRQSHGCAGACVSHV